MKQKATLSFGGILLAVLTAVFYPKLAESSADNGNAANPAGVQAPATSGTQQGANTAAKVPAAASTSAVGFTSRAAWQSHFEKHCREFGDITADDYLAKAKALRDAPLSSDVLEIVRDDRVITRFDKPSGAFIAFHDDKSIRTFFKPNNGLAYFHSQAGR